jgi:hypothetical protein
MKQRHGVDLCDCGQTAPRTDFRPYFAASAFEIALTCRKSEHQFRRLDCYQLVFD